FDRNQQPLDLMFVGNDTGACLGHFDAGRLRDLRWDDSHGQFFGVLVSVIFAFSLVMAVGLASLGRGIVLGWRCGFVPTSRQGEGKQEQAQQGGGLHGVSPTSVAGAGATKGWPVRRWISIRARWAARAASSCWRRVSVCAALRGVLS